MVLFVLCHDPKKIQKGDPKRRFGCRPLSSQSFANPEAPGVLVGSGCLCNPSVLESPLAHGNGVVGGGRRAEEEKRSLDLQADSWFTKQWFGRRCFDYVLR